ncbi:MAG: 4Fe-4S ferredoxin [bacterium]|nr:4Fe-4S ferredoxin [bacterium]
MNLTESIREEVKKVLKSGDAEVAIGYEAGTVPLAARPVFVRTPEDADKLVYEPYRSGGIARYVQSYVRTRRKARDFDPAAAKKVAVVARPCDVRALVNYIVENQFAREDVYIVGINCPGVVERNKVYDKVDAYDVAGVAVNGSGLSVTTRSGDAIKLPLDEVLAPVCARCTHREPPVADVTLGDKVEAPDIDPFAVVAEFEAKSADERWGWFAEEMNRCIRCRACRQACPMCYCEECFADQTNPDWIGQTALDADAMGFHVGRLFHMAGRCVDCGVCESVCPVNIPLTTLNRKLDQVVFEKFKFESGLDLETEAPLSTYHPDDPDDGFM